MKKICHSNEMTVGRRIRAARLFRGLSQTYITEKTGIAQATLHAYEFDRHLPPLDKLELIADVLKVSPAYLAGWAKGSEKQ